MSTLLAPPARREQHLLLRGVSWDYYDRTLRELGGKHLRIIFDEGSLEITTVGDLHERVKFTIIG